MMARRIDAGHFAKVSEVTNSTVLGRVELSGMLQ